MTIKWKRPLYLFHRWAGIVLCAFFALWFCSGIFMMYVEFPQLSLPERRIALPGLDFSHAQLRPGDAVARLRAGDFDTQATPAAMQTRLVENPRAALTQIDSLRLAMLLGRPLYVVTADGRSQPRAIYADSGERVERITDATALAVAQDFAERALPGYHGRPEYLERLQTDQWTVSASLNAHRPLHLVALGDEAGTELYVSSRTGEVVRDSTRLERVLNYAGAVTHWLYPTVIRRYADAWSWFVDIVASAGTLLALSGICVGLLRIKRRRKSGKSAIPYRGLMRWHHLAGLSFGLTALTWVLSGLLSMNPGKLNPPRSAHDDEALVYAGKTLTPSDFAMRDFSGRDVIDAELMHYGAHPYYLVTPRSGTPRLLAASDAAAPLPNIEALRQHAAELLPSAALASAEVLTAYDDHYYTRHPERGTHPLPVLRVRFADADATWFHLDPATGRVLNRSTRTNRLYRWLYNGLHSWDLRWLWEHRPLWDLAVIAFSLGGLALSVTGVIAGLRRLRYDAAQRAKQRTASALSVSAY